jgi:hypothetical protein
VLLAASLAYGTWGTRRLAERGSERQTFDRPLVAMAGRLVRPPDTFPMPRVTTPLELELSALVRDQQDLLFGLTVLLFRVVASATVGGLGLVLLTAGSTEWELRGS